ncbi:hypothetical protein [Winslowiella toletana]|uniref:hypothetical protein n=1 Tax=Winslowiella toletana TaxID=92490 RepID=UPI0028BF3D9B|nr:hypothetical protein [Winslowiella toletana]WNN45460.1 hypothetical protein RIN69_06065 [Winslowiella toletana]
MSNLLARLNRLEKAMVTKDGDVQVISALMDELAGNAPAGTYECAVERLSRRGNSFPQSAELKALLVGDGSEQI